MPQSYSDVATQVAFAANARHKRYIPRGKNQLHVIFEKHFSEFCKRFAQKYGRFRLPRIESVGERFGKCGDFQHGVARIRCTNPECGHDHGELFRKVPSTKDRERRRTVRQVRRLPTRGRPYPVHQSRVWPRPLSAVQLLNVSEASSGSTSARRVARNVALQSARFLFAEHLTEEVLLNLPHRQFVFALPKALRIFFRHDAGYSAMSRG